MPRTALAAGMQGDVLQTDSLGLGIVTRDFTAHTTKTLSDSANLSEFVGLHYYFVDRFRVGMNLQFTEQLTPALPMGESRWRTFSFLPQLGCNFYDPFFAGLIYKLAPRTNGQSKFDMAVQGLLGVAYPVSNSVRITLALEVPFAFYVHRTLGLTLLSGVSIRL